MSDYRLVFAFIMTGLESWYLDYSKQRVFIGVVKVIVSSLYASESMPFEEIERVSRVSQFWLFGRGSKTFPFCLPTGIWLTEQLCGGKVNLKIICCVYVC